MVESRLVDRIEPGTYRLGIRLLELGNLVKSRISVRQEALPHMQSLHQELGETVNLSVRHDDEVVYIERTAPPSSMMRVVQIIGARAPLHITAVGKIFLAQTSVDCRLAKRTGFRVHATRSPIRSAVREVERVRSRLFLLQRGGEKASLVHRAGISTTRRIVSGLSVSSRRTAEEGWAHSLLQTRRGSRARAPIAMSLEDVVFLDLGPPESAGLRPHTKSGGEMRAGGWPTNVRRLNPCRRIPRGIRI